MPRLRDDVGRVFDVADVGAVVDELHVFYVDRHVFLVEVSGPADPVLERRVVPGVHLPLRVVEKLKLEGKKKNKHTHEPFAKAEVPNATEGAPQAAKPGKGRGTAGASSGTHARRGFRSHGSNPVSVGETNSHVTSHPLGIPVTQRSPPAFFINKETGPRSRRRQEVVSRAQGGATAGAARSEAPAHSTELAVPTQKEA